MRRTLIAGGLALLLLATACGESRRSGPPAAAGSPTASRQDRGGSSGPWPASARSTTCRCTR
ncbi:hypothetical protein V2I01_35860 [Micromonospora sp. BRA006-A]|nr:hypothetical protein [Micromonospora sp. BRA006-A]